MAKITADHPKPARVCIIHPWLPQYRVPFFEELVRRGAERAIEFSIFYGEVPPEWGPRGDEGESRVAQRLPTRFFRVGHRNVNLKSLAKVHDAAPFDLLIVEQAIRNLETYRLSSRAVAPRTAMWGHGRTYTAAKSAFEERLKEKVTLRTDWFFAYTRGGASAVRDAGFPISRITIVNNTIDATQLRADLRAVPESTQDDLRQKFHLRGRTALYIGGLDSAKRLDMLFASADLVAAREPDFRLVIAGAGADRLWVANECASRSWAHLVAPVFGADKAALLRVCDVMLFSGRVGLAAVDSFVAELPIVTTKWRYHAPEFEYLRDGDNARVCENSAVSLGLGLHQVLFDDLLLNRLRRGAAQSSALYSVEKMVGNFLDGVQTALTMPVRRSRWRGGSAH